MVMERAQWICQSKNIKKITQPSKRLSFAMESFLNDLIRREQALSEEDVTAFMNNTDKFGGAFVINMESKPERLISAANTLSKVGLSFTRFKAISGAKILAHPEQYSFDVTSFFSILRPGEVGCVLSHLSIINLASQHPEQNNYTLIFEDDIVTSATSVSDIFTRVAAIDERENVDLLYLGKCLECCSKMTLVEDIIWRAVAPSCGHAYAIKNAFAKKIMIDIAECSYGAPNCEYFNRGIDSILGDYTINTESNTLVIHPAIFMQDVLTTSSDLRSSFLHNYLECRDTTGENNDHRDSDRDADADINGPDWLKIVLFVIVGVVILVLLTKFITKHQKTSLCITIIVLFVYMIALTTYLTQRIWNTLPETESNNFFESGGQTMTIESFQAPNLTSPAISQHFEVDSTNLLTKEYKAFNPNAVVIDDAIVTAFRVSNGKASYPLVQVFDTNLKLIKSKKINIKSQRKILDYKMPLGYEDMRIFEHNGKIGLIGVNLDRNELEYASMVLAQLDENFNTVQVVHLDYPPLSHKTNKNWAPISLSSDKLGFIVSVDPLLIVTQVNDEGLCEKVIEMPTKLKQSAVRNSSITLKASALSQEYQDVLKITEPQNEFFMLVHTKYVEADFKKDGKLIQYQHYIAIVDPYKGTVRLSKPFHVEQANKPHIEYVSGFFFHPDGTLIVTYGLRDEEAKYFPLSAKNMSVLM
jgi:hypothetical protein